MSLLVVGSVAYDGVETPHGKVDRMLGGAGTYIALAASHFTKVKLVGVVGDDFAAEDEQLLADHKVDLEQRPTAESDTLADLYINTGWVKVIVVDAVAQLMAGFPLASFDVEFITQMLRAESKSPGEGTDIRNSLLQLRGYLIQPLRRQLRRYNHDVVVIDKSY